MLMLEYRLRMNIKTLNEHSLKKGLLMFVGQLKWQLISKQEYHGSCASKLMLLIQWLVLLLN